MYDPSFFAEELDLIKNGDLRSMTLKVLEEAPAWFWTAPASISGLHHPPDDLIEGGLCIHVKKVAWLGHRFFDALNEDTDIGVSAALLHDIRRSGPNDEPGGFEDYKRHAAMAADYLIEFGRKQFGHGAKCEATWGVVCLCVRKHMGKWEEHIPPFALMCQLLHLADVAASFRLLVGLPFYTDDLPKLNDVMEAGKHFIERDGEILVNFGKKHYRKKAMDVMKTDPGYFKWMLKSGFPDDVSEQVRQIQELYRGEEKKRQQLEAGNLPLGE